MSEMLLDGDRGQFESCWILILWYYRGIWGNFKKEISVIISLEMDRVLAHIENPTYRRSALVNTTSATLCPTSNRCPSLSSYVSPFLYPFQGTPPPIAAFPPTPISWASVFVSASTFNFRQLGFFNSCVVKKRSTHSSQQASSSSLSLSPSYFPPPRATLPPPVLSSRRRGIQSSFTSPYSPSICGVSTKKNRADVMCSLSLSCPRQEDIMYGFGLRGWFRRTRLNAWIRVCFSLQI